MNPYRLKRFSGALGFNWRNSRTISGSPVNSPLLQGGLSVARIPVAGDVGDSRTSQTAGFEADILTRLTREDLTVPIAELEDRIEELASNDSEVAVSLISLRFSFLRMSRKLRPETIINCLSLFAKEGIPDHHFFKEMGKAILPAVEDLSVSQISNLLRSHALVGATECDLFAAICSRLKSIINKATMHTIGDILTSLSLIGLHLVDIQKMVDLCLNRYSLCVKDDMGVEMDRDVLASLARLRIPNLRVIRKAQQKITCNPHRLHLDSIVEVMGSLHVLGADTSEVWRSIRSKYFNDLSVHSSKTHSDLSSVLGPMETDLCVKAAVICSNRLSGNPETVPEDLIVCYKHAMTLTTLSLTEPEKFQTALRKLSVSDLISIQRLMTLSHSSVEPKNSVGTFIKSRSLELSKTNIGGLFVTQLASVKTKPEKKKARKSIQL